MWVTMLLVWLALQLPVGLMVGRWLAAGGVKQRRRRQTLPNAVSQNFSGSLQTER